jgi:hypothetical protein
LDFGNWIKDKPTDTGHPYIQIASVTNAANARDDFIKTRLSGVDTTGDAKWQLLPKEQMQHSPVSEEEKKKKYQELVLSRWPYILTGCLVFVLIVVGLCIWRCCCRKSAKKGSKTKKGMFSGEPESTAYLPLQDPNRSKEAHSPLGHSPFDASTASLGGHYPSDVQYSPGQYPPPQYHHGGGGGYQHHS